MLSWADQWSYLLIAAVGWVIVQGAASRLLFRRSAKSSIDVWAKLDTVGLTSGLLYKARAIAASIASTQRYSHDGYLRFSKPLDRPFAMPTTLTRTPIVVLPPSLLPLLNRPDKTTEAEWSNLPGMTDMIQAPYAYSDPSIYQNMFHFDAFRRRFAKHCMPAMAAITAEEIARGFSEVWGNTPGKWKVLNAWEASGRISVRAAQRIIVGLPLGRDERFLEASRLFANAVFVYAGLINCFPPVCRPVVGPIFSMPTRRYQRQCIAMLTPLIEERIAIWRKFGEEGEEVPDDFLQWLIPCCAEEGPEKLEPASVACRLLGIMTTSIVSVSFVFSHCLVDLFDSPDAEDFVRGLEAECRRVSQAHNDSLSTTEAVDSLYRCDSALRESMRLSDVSITSLFRDVKSGSVDLGNGIHIPPGVRMVFPTQSMHRDAAYYEDPDRFDAFRFSRQFEGLGRDEHQASGSQPRELITSITPSFLVFGYGRHTCPGRWWASQVLKQMMAHLIMNYDIELVGKPTKVSLAEEA
ncbi:cytochrome P450 [Thozetella sp. PMI_491]|nr:cytochrome P450 [Thozetella sp. PMI_491]